jgi:TolB protein
MGECHELERHKKKLNKNPLQLSNTYFFKLSIFWKKKRINLFVCFLCIVALTLSETSNPIASDTPMAASDPKQIRIDLSGSLQNPAWGPPGSDSIVFTRYRNGYGSGPADLLTHNLRSNVTRPIIADGFNNVNLPGSAWNARTNRVTFSSTRTKIDQIFTIGSDGDRSSLTQHSDNLNFASYEPSFSPDGQSVVYESHPLGKEDNGVIIISSVRLGNSRRAVSALDGDCRQPNWSPAGNQIVFQCLANRQWDLWIRDLKSGKNRQLTTGSGDKTDASFSPDGRWIVFSLDNGSQQIGDLYIISASKGNANPLTRSPFYEGAPSWSADGRYVIYELTTEAPTRNSKATIWHMAVPAQYRRQ